MEQTITRSINDYCWDAADFKKPKDDPHNLFERVGPATYRLRSYPKRPDTIELIRIEFEEPAMQSTWTDFAELMRKKAGKRWADATNEKKLTAFVTNMKPGKPYQRIYEVRRGVAVNDLDDIGLL